MYILKQTFCYFLVIFFNHNFGNLSGLKNCNHFTAIGSYNLFTGVAPSRSVGPGTSGIRDQGDLMRPRLPAVNFVPPPVNPVQPPQYSGPGQSQPTQSTSYPDLPPAYEETAGAAPPPKKSQW